MPLSPASSSAAPSFHATIIQYLAMAIDMPQVTMSMSAFLDIFDQLCQKQVMEQELTLLHEKLAMAPLQ